MHEIFEEGVGTLKGVTAKIHVDPAATPVFCKARPVAYALRDKIEQDLDRLHKAGKIEPVQFAEWATPVVPVVNPDSSVRVCGDYKLDAYPIPKLKQNLTSAMLMSKCWLEESKKFITINTQRLIHI